MLDMFKKEVVKKTQVIVEMLGENEFRMRGKKTSLRDEIQFTQTPKKHLTSMPVNAQCSYLEGIPAPQTPGFAMSRWAIAS